VVSPEGTGTQPDRPKSGRGILLAIAALVIAAGFAVLGALSPAEELAIETTTTTTATTSTVIEAPIDLDNFDVGQIVTGEPLELARATEVVDGYPLALVEHDGGLYAFVTNSSDWLPSSGGLLAWHSEDGSAWSPLGMVIDERFHVTRVIGTGESMLAVGASIDDGTVILWESWDGVDWEAMEVGARPVSTHTRTIPTAVGSNGETTVVATTVGEDILGIVEAALSEAGFEIDLADRGWGLDTDGEGRSVITIYGPLGIALDQVDLDQLDLDDEDRQTLEGSYRSNPQESSLWVHNASGWSEHVIPDMYGVETITSLPDGRLVARGWGNTGMSTAITEDGQVWTSRGSGEAGPWSAAQWGELLVGPDDMSIPELLISDDGETWEKAGLASDFPVAIHWSSHPMAAGPAGVALAVSGSSAGPQIGTQEPTSFVTDKGFTVRLDPMDGRLVVESDGLSHSWRVYGNTETEDLLVDLAAETIELLDPEAGISFGQVTFAVLDQAEDEYYRTQYRGDEHRALVFTSDGENWTIQDLADSIGPEAVITNLMVGSDRLVAVVLPEGDWYYPMVDPGFEIWTAPLP